MSAALTRSEHPGELTLRRLRAGEDVGPEATRHAAFCAQCKARVAAFAHEQQRFEAEVPFERFAAGVQRAARLPRPAAAARGPLLQVVLALAAGLLVVVGAGQFAGMDGAGRNRLKGGSGVEVVVAGSANGPQRSAATFGPEALARGERVRIGYRAGSWRYLAVVSVDQAGQVTPLYPERGTSLAVPGHGPTAWLPDSIAFTGAGLERVTVVLSDQPAQLEELVREARRSFDAAHGDVARMGPLQVPGEQFHRTFLKP